MAGRKPWVGTHKAHAVRGEFKAARREFKEASGIALGWEDVKDLPAGWVVTRRVTDDTLPGGPVERTIEYHAPFTRCDREDDYKRAWAAFSERFRDA